MWKSQHNNSIDIFIDTLYQLYMINKPTFAEVIIQKHENECISYLLV